MDGGIREPLSNLNSTSLQQNESSKIKSEGNDSKICPCQQYALPREVVTGNLLLKSDYHVILHSMLNSLLKRKDFRWISNVNSKILLNLGAMTETNEDGSVAVQSVGNVIKQLADSVPRDESRGAIMPVSCTKCKETFGSMKELCDHFLKFHCSKITCLVPLSPSRCGKQFEDITEFTFHFYQQHMLAKFQDFIDQYFLPK